MKKNFFLAMACFLLTLTFSVGAVFAGGTATEDIPVPTVCPSKNWKASGFWETFPEGKEGVDVIDRDSSPTVYKYKKVKKRNGEMSSSLCFESPNLFSVEKIGEIFGRQYLLFRDFRPKGDGGQHNTVMVLEEK